MTRPPTKCLDFERVVAEFYGPLFQFALSLARTEPDACDLTQHTFYVWAAKGYQLREPTKIKTWLFTTLHNAFLEDRRRRGRFSHYGLEEVSSDLPVLSSINVDQLDSAEVPQALAKLEEIYRKPVVLFYFRDHSYKEIGGILGLPLGTVKSRISRGIVQLGVLLKRDELGGARLMTRGKVRQILNLYRPGTLDALDPAFSEALGLCERDTRLRKWFAQHCAAYSAVRSGFRQIPVPQGFKEQIIGESVNFRKQLT